MTDINEQALGRLAQFEKQLEEHGPRPQLSGADISILRAAIYGRQLHDYAEGAQASVWHQERKTQDATEYYTLIRDEEETISFILKYDKAKKEVVAEPYSPPDLDYTVHDACEHEYGCVLDDPESFEAQDEAMANKYSYAARNLENLEKQLRQRRIAEREIARRNLATVQGKKA